MSLTVQELILQNLITNSEFSSRVLPFLKSDYFPSREEKVLFDCVNDYTLKYKTPPTIEAIYISLSKNEKISEKDAESVDRLLTTIKTKTEPQKIEWLLETCEKFCQDRAIHNAVVEAISIIEGEGKIGRGGIPDLLKNALAVGFETSLGHDFITNAPHRFDYYHQKDIKVPFDISWMNTITKGGFSKKTLNLYLAQTHAGKTALMCHHAAANIQDGKRVVYFTLEISEEEISKRVDANVMNLTIDQILQLDKKSYLTKIDKLQKNIAGRLIVKEYPMATAGVGHFRNFLNELKLKQNFTPDIVYVDYLNLCLSVRMKGNVNANSYTYMKAVSEELRGFASEFNIPIVSASQFNRGAAGQSDPNLSDISESYAVGFGVDFVAALIADDNMKERGVVLIKQLKNRYDDMGRVPKFFVGFDRAKMKFYDVDSTATEMKEKDNESFSEGIAREIENKGYEGFKFE